MDMYMKRILIITLIVGMLMAFSGCGNRIAVNDTLIGQSGHWSITYDIKGRVYTRVDRDGNERLTIFGKFSEEIKYIGDMTDLQNTTGWKAVWDINGQQRLRSESNRSDPYTKPPVSKGWGGISMEIFSAVYNDEPISVIISWNGDNGEEETIDLQY